MGSSSRLSSEDVGRRAGGGKRRGLRVLGSCGFPGAVHARDEPRVPAHWCRFDRRGSEITGNPRLATDTTNAILNYLYALLEPETTVACRALGLDPGMGMLFADAPAQSSSRSM